MPRYRRYRNRRRIKVRKPNRRRRYVRRNKRRRLPINAFPKSMLARLRYTEEFAMNITSVSPEAYTFRANSLYDPNMTQTGHQPRGFDRLMEMYDHYTVVGSKITIQHAPTSGSNVIPAYVDVIMTDDAAVGVGNVIDLFETHQGRGKPQQFGTERNYIGFNPRITRKFSAKKFFGHSVAGKPQYMGTAVANPSELAYFHVILCPIAGNDPGAMNMIAQIEYIAIFSEPKYEQFS